MKSRLFHVDGTLPVNNDWVFVFGSNQGGIHGAGAAKVAADKYGAIRGNGLGLRGNSYAIPTKDWYLKTLSFQEIEKHVNNFIDITKKYPDKKWFVTRIGCGLAGLENENIAPLFKDAQNCSFAKEWEEFLKE